VVLRGFVPAIPLGSVAPAEKLRPPCAIIARDAGDHEAEELAHGGPGDAVLCRPGVTAGRRPQCLA